MEEALAICIWYANSSVHGYTLASDYFRNYDPRYGTMARFIFTVEARGADEER